MISEPEVRHQQSHVEVCPLNLWSWYYCRNYWIVLVLTSGYQGDIEVSESTSPDHGSLRQQLRNAS